MSSQDLREILQLVSSLCTKGCRLAIAFRSDPTCLAKLSLAKHGDAANDRFAVDYKSLADVLVQAAVRYGLASKYPCLASNVFGEEDTTFNRSADKTVNLDPSKRDSFEASLSTVLGQDLEDLRQKVIDIIYSDAPHDPDLDRNVSSTDHLQNLDLNDCGIWVDPIDGTNIYVSQSPDAQLDHVTVLIGAFSLKTGYPLFGVVGVPFSGRGGIPTQHYAVAEPGHPLVSSFVRMIPFVPPQPVILASHNDKGFSGVQKAIEGTKWSVKHESGAGYKLLSLLLYKGSISLVSPHAKIYSYDICAPHSLLRAKGGGIVPWSWFKQADFSCDEETAVKMLNENQVKYGPKSGADSYTIKDGIISYIDPGLLIDFAEVMKRIE